MTSAQVQDAEDPCTTLDSLSTCKPISINRAVENEEGKQQQAIDSASPPTDNVTAVPSPSAQSYSELRVVLERNGFVAIGDAHLFRIGKAPENTPLNVFERWLKERLKHGNLGSGALLLVAADVRRRWATKVDQQRTASRMGVVPSCDQCSGIGYTGHAPGANSIAEIRAALNAKSIQLCACESGRTMDGIWTCPHF